MWVLTILVLGTLALVAAAVAVRRANRRPRRGVG
jgi:hypothetical protein